METPHTFTHHAHIELFNGRFADVEHGLEFPAGTRLLIGGGKIEALLPPEQDSPGCPRIDLGGRAVIPGLFNTHCHIQLVYPSMLLGPSDFGALKKYSQRQIEKSMADCLTHGVLHVRDTLSSDLRPNKALRARIGSGGLPGPRIHQSVLVSPLGGTFTSNASLFDRLIEIGTGATRLAFDDPNSGAIAFPASATDRQVREAVNLAIDQNGAEFIKLYDQREFAPSYAPGARLMTDAQMAAAVDQAHKRGLKVTLHHVLVESFRRGVRAGVDSFAHLPLDGHLTSADVEAFLRAGCILEPTTTLIYYLAWKMPNASWNSLPRLAQLEAYRDQTAAGLVERFWIPEFHPSALGHFARARQGKYRLMGLMDMSAAFRYWAPMLERGVDNLRRLHDAGATIACGSDAGAAAASEAMVNLELSMLAFALNQDGRDGCFNPADALRAATLHSARALGLETRFGSLSPGKFADLVVLDGDPLSDLSRTGASAAAVFVDGQVRHNPAGLAVQA